jgi:hypothetical protein
MSDLSALFVVLWIFSDLVKALAIVMPWWAVVHRPPGAPVVHCAHCAPPAESYPPAGQPRDVVRPTGPAGLSDRGRAILEAAQRQEWEAAMQAPAKWGPYG